MESDELLEHLQQMEEEIQILELENMLLQSYSERNLTHGEELDDKVAKKQSRRSAKKEKVPVELSVSQRTNIALEVNETVKSEIDECKNISEKLVDDLRALLELADVNITDVSKETYEFKRDVQNMSVPGKSANDRLLHHLEEKLRSKDSAIDKLSLKNNALKQQILKLGNQLQHKEEMGEVLHVIDFDQLKIENQQFLEKIEERNNELLKLKLTTGNITQTLNGSKKKLQRQVPPWRHGVAAEGTDSRCAMQADSGIRNIEEDDSGKERADEESAAGDQGDRDREIESAESQLVLEEADRGVGHA